MTRRSSRPLRLLAPAAVGMVLVACSSSTPSASPTPPSPSLSPSDTTPPPSPTPSPPAGFACAGPFSGGSVSHGPTPIQPTVTNVRAGGRTGFDRFVVEFDASVPTYKITLQGTPTFTLDPKGTKVTLEGTSGVLIHIEPENWTAYAGPNGLRPELPFLKQARMVQNFEGTMQWGLGIQGTPCLQISSLKSPPRLVVDVAGV